MVRLGYTLLFVCFACLTNSKAQVYVNGSAIDSETVYCQLIGQNATALYPVRVAIDYGQPFQQHRDLRRQQITGPDRKLIVFESVINALNFMDRNGWDLVSVQVTQHSSDSLPTYTYLLRQRSAARNQGR